jgi:hypothetical protein
VRDGNAGGLCNQRRSFDARHAVTVFLFDAFNAVNADHAIGLDVIRFGFFQPCFQRQVFEHRGSGRDFVKAPGRKCGHGCTSGCGRCAHTRGTARWR